MPLEVRLANGTVDSFPDFTECTYHKLAFNGQTCPKCLRQENNRHRRQEAVVEDGALIVRRYGRQTAYYPPGVWSNWIHAT